MHLHKIFDIKLLHKCIRRIINHVQKNEVSVINILILIFDNISILMQCKTYYLHYFPDLRVIQQQIRFLSQKMKGSQILYLFKNCRCYHFYVTLLYKSYLYELYLQHQQANQFHRCRQLSFLANLHWKMQMMQTFQIYYNSLSR